MENVTFFVDFRIFATSFVSIVRGGRRGTLRKAHGAGSAMDDMDDMDGMDMTPSAGAPRYGGQAGHRPLTVPCRCPTCPTGPIYPTAVPAVSASRSVHLEK